jgi:hypothetical protein
MKYEIPPEFRQFVAHVKRRCKANRIELVMSPSRNVVVTDSFSTDCAGYFDDVNRTLVVACGKPFNDWIEILVHEYSHMEQWLGDERWSHWSDCCYNLWAWLDKDRIMNNAQLTELMDGMIELERDCEVRALENIRRWNLPINKSRYARKANLYLYSYRAMPVIRKFPTGLYDNKALIDMCPPRMYKRYESVPKPVMDVLVKTYG